LRFPLQPAGPIILPSVITGPKTVQKADLLLDTGAEYCSISTELAISLGYNLDGSHRKVSIITANGSIKIPSVLVLEIRVGSAYAHHVAVTCQDIPEIPEISGFIGLNFLRRCRTIIDYKRQILDLVRFNVHA
jgi:clan AA aspartic protease (TIGR02281 family)